METIFTKKQIKLCNKLSILCGNCQPTVNNISCNFCNKQKKAEKILSKIKKIKGV